MAAAQRWINPSKHRYYEVRVLQNLFGQWEVQRIWGGVGSALGTVRYDPQASEADCAEAVQAIEKRRAARGYQ